MVGLNDGTTGLGEGTGLIFRSGLYGGPGLTNSIAASGPPAWVPAKFVTAALYISWTTQAPDSSWGMAWLGGSRAAVAANTLGALVQGAGSAIVSAAGLTVSAGGNFLFSDVSWLSQQPGTIYTNASISTSNSTAWVFILSNGSANLSNLYALRDTGLSVRAVAVSGGVSGIVSSGFLATLNVPYKAAVSFGGTALTIYVNGTNTNSAIVTAVSSLSVAIIGSSPTGVNPFAGTITEAAYFATALNAGTTPTLQAVTQ